MATKKKRLANSLRENSDAQASWGNKVRAPKVSDKGNAMVEGGRNKAAHAAGQSTVSTRARYATAVSKANKNARKEISDWESNTKKTGSKMKNKAGAASYWGGKTKAPINYIGGNKVDVGENARGKTMYGLGKGEVRFRGVEKERRNTVKNAKIGSVGGKNKARTTQWVSDFPVTFVNDARSRADNLSRGVVDSYKKREKEKEEVMPKKKDKAQEALTALMQKDYFAYCFGVLNDGINLAQEKPRYVPTRFHKWLCATVWEWVTRPTINPYDILLLSVPPQHGKSITITETLPSFYLGHFPEKRVIEVSYGSEFAKRFGKANKNKIQRFGGLFGISIASDAKSNVDWKLSNGIGGMISKGIMSPITGQSGDLIIVDDPIKNSQEASSETQRQNLWNEWQNTIMSRVQTGTKIIVIQTRWHEDDLIGRLKEKPFTTYYNLEALNESEDDPLGRKIGEALCPEMGKDEKWLENYKEGLTSGQIDEGGESGLRAWEALFQGHPSNKEGNILKREWWQFYEGQDMDYDTVIMSVDPAFKDTNDYVAIGIWGKKNANIFLIDLVREHLNFEATMQVMMQKKALYQPSTILVEDKANGSAIIETLRKKIMGVVGVNPRDSKEERVNAVSFVIESGNVYLPKDRSFTPMFIEECAQFPNAKHDDMVDQMTQALARLIWTTGKRQRLMRRKTLIEDMLHKSGRSATGKGDKRVVI